MLSIFVGIISALALVIWELLNAPMGYESEDGFRIASRKQFTAATLARGARARESPIPHKRRLAANRLVRRLSARKNLSRICPEIAIAPTAMGVEPTGFESEASG